MKIGLPLTIIITLLFSGCSSSTKVYTTYDKKVDFSSYKTFDFYEIKEEYLHMKEVNRRRLEMAIELELGMKGIKKSVNNPDLMVNLYSILNRTENTTTSSTYPYSGGYYGGASPYGGTIGVSVSPGNNSQYYTEGSVTVHLVDRKENKLVLEGVAQIDAGEGEDADRLINYTVQKFLADIPYPKKK